MPIHQGAIGQQVPTTCTLVALIYSGKESERTGPETRIKSVPQHNRAATQPGD